MTSGSVRAFNTAMKNGSGGRGKISPGLPGTGGRNRRAAK